ncbi:LLM class F420-dependent oxidoreductase [Planosporangium flavigriseum]|uniref:LLM class F420-dependent oxidoreductase n=1 Tax=Planosporangium flavigriseum TaxID=373681 RepID=A0A8J3LTC8_9ACTN|nr:LLM class F420-dependent oxidoreductase [Planosporangium flavigriseum]NJC64029.1 LLM class F420-dependent oxidoreductase [Planosporangium flavigriseum]GIG72910.1 LLM class F420-dependent oxidoreductase [Planosporangium flavigriseum]
MRLVIFTEPQQGASYDDQLRIARHAEELGFDGFFRSDHYLVMGEGDGLPGPTDSWVTLGALAVQTSRIKLGTLVTSATFRYPGPLAISVAQVDQMSGGRVELGLGAGWYEPEHKAYGIPFPPVKERFDRLEEQLAIVTGLWTTPVGERFNFDGTHYRIEDSPALPKPVQDPGPPVIIGGKGAKRTPMLAARYAHEFNVPFAPVDETAQMYERVTEACKREGRDQLPVFSAAQTIACGRTEAEARKRAEVIGRIPPEYPFYGTPAQVVDQIGQYAEAGATRLFLQILDMTDLDHLDVIASEIAPQLP